MNTNLASYIMGMVIDENDHFYFVQKDGQTYSRHLKSQQLKKALAGGRSQKCAKIWESLWIQGFQISRLLSH